MRPTRFLSLATVAALLLAGCTASPQTEEAASSPSPEPTVTSAEPTPHVYNRHLTWEEAMGDGPTLDPAEDERRHYRPANAEGPAQKVPRPQIPEGMHEDTEEGLIKFIFYWISLADYGMETGDFNELYSLSGTMMVEEYSHFALTAKHYREGGWVEGGHYSVYLMDYFEDFYGDGTRVYGTLIEQQNELWHGKGDAELIDNTAGTFTPTFFKAKFIDGKWVMEDVQEKHGTTYFLEGQRLGITGTAVGAHALHRARDSFAN